MATPYRAVHLSLQDSLDAILTDLLWYGIVILIIVVIFELGISYTKNKKLLAKITIKFKQRPNHPELHHRIAIFYQHAHTHGNHHHS